ncbi:MAG: hypothetical protein ACYTG0_13230 [Planctomycetota bacterium]
MPISAVYRNPANFLHPRHSNVVDETRVGPNVWQMGATIFNRASSPSRVSVGFAYGSIGWYKPVR